jgi:hypothetical protein
MHDTREVETASEGEVEEPALPGGSDSPDS